MERINSNVIQQSIDIALAHLEQAAAKPEAAAQYTDTAASEIAALKLEVEKQKKQLAVFNTNQQAVPSGDKASNGKKRRVRDRTPWAVCTICNRKHASSPPESRCFKRDLEGEKKALDELIKLKAEQAKKNVSN